MKFIYSIVILFISNLSMAQDLAMKEEVENKPIFIPGVYMTFEDFITNYPIEPWQIQTDINPDSRDYYSHLVKESKVKVSQGDSVYTINPKNMWGYSDGTGIYINRAIFPKELLEYTRKDISVNPWAKINILGTLSLIHYFKTIQSSYFAHPTDPSLYFSPLYKNGNANIKAAEFILDTRDGQIHEATLTNLEEMISHDLELLEEFKKFRKDQDIKLYIFLKKYNKKHPTNFN